MSARALVAGASGALGGAVVDALADDGFAVVATNRAGGEGFVALDPIGDPRTLTTVAALGPFDAVVWAQGANVNDSAKDVDIEVFRQILDANVTFVAASMSALLSADAISDGARLVVISSIWQELAKPAKFSYTVSKAAVGGLVRAASVDLAPREILINAVMPAVVDSEMTRAMLSETAIERFADQTGFGRLVDARDVARTVGQLCSPQNTAITGQSIRVDLGFSHARLV